MLGATGTIGRATVTKLTEAGYEVVCLVRPSAASGSGSRTQEPRVIPAATVRFSDVTDPDSIQRDAIRGEQFDILVSCLASRTGAPNDAWKIDHDAHVNVLNAAKAAGVSQVVLLSAICVQRPLLEFQRAKLAFEKVLTESGLTYSIVRPTAFFKSLSGQIARVKRGKPFLVFGNGELTACKPISDSDLGAYIVDCIDNPARHNCVLPIGGPGEAITPRQQGEHLFSLLGKPPKIKEVPVRMLDIIIAVLDKVGRVFPAMAAKAELARIGRYYATESMLVLDSETGQYDADATPSSGSEMLFDYYAKVLNGESQPERGEHAVF